MNEKKELLSAILRTSHLVVLPENKTLLDEFLKDDENNVMMEEIVENTNRLAENWRLQEKVRTILDFPLRVPNGTVGKAYEALFDPATVGLPEISDFTWEGLEDVGLSYQKENKKISGTPVKSGDLTIKFRFKVEGQRNEDFLEKAVPLTINPDPKSLWKNIPSDNNDPYWKEDNVTVFSPLGQKHILVSSKRGRSHANNGGFREDDFGFSELANGWAIAIVADGAGSAKFSRKGSSLACAHVINYFSEEKGVQGLSELDAILATDEMPLQDEIEKKINRLVYTNLGGAALAAHKHLEAYAIGEKMTIKDLSTTLIFTLIKKYEKHFAILSFGVGDCPIAILNKDVTEVTMMNRLDVGEYGGGTRFITMPEIFRSDKFSTRFGFRFVDDFSFLMLMSDGIYDPKFVVESALEDIEKWKSLLQDLDGQNPEGVKVNLQKDNPEITQQLSAWMDFWSPGNHDDRTLAIIF